MAASLGERAVSSGGRPSIRARVLGDFHVSVDGRPIERATWQRVSAERLTKLLLITEGHALPRELAIEKLWPDVDPVTGRNKLRRALSFARRALGAHGVLHADGERVRLDPAGLDLDLDRLRAAFDQLTRAETRSPLCLAPEGLSGAALAPDPGDRRESDAVEIILELGGRSLLPDDAYEDWLVGPREQLFTRWQIVALEAARRAIAGGRTATAHAVLDQVLDHDPTDEAAHRLVIELYASEGRHHAARRQFELCRRALEANLDVKPSAETEAAYHRAEVASVASAAPAPRPRLVARQHELEQIEPLLDRLSAGRSASLVIRGPAGIGKTRLLDEVRDLIRGAGWRQLAWQGTEATQSFAFAPFALRLGELVTAAEVDGWDEPERTAVATVVPGLGVRPHLEFADRSALIVAVVAAFARLARERPHIIAIDDLPWLDDASTDVVASLASAFADVPILLAVTFRDEEPVPDSTAALLEGLRRRRALELTVGPLAERDMEPLVLAHLGGESIAADLSAWLFRQSEGNPLFCLEVARDSAERGAIRLDGGRWLRTAIPLPEAPRAVRELVANRIGALEPPATRLLQAAAELGPVVGFDTLAAVLPDLEGGLIAALDAALSSGLLVEHGAGYSFAHSLFRAAVESEAGTARRAVLHLALARALAGGTGEGDPDEVPVATDWIDPGPPAEHALVAYELGLRKAGPLAVALGFAAGTRAQQLFDRDAATDYLRRSTAIWGRLLPSVAARFDATTAFVNLAELLMAADDEASAEAAFRAALDAARTAEELAFAYDRFSFLGYRHGDFAATVSLCEEALGRLPPDAAAARAVIDVRIGFCLGRLHRVDEAVAHLEDAVRVLDRAGDRAQLCQALNHLGPFLVFTGRNAEGLAALNRSLALALDLRDARLETMARIHVAGCLARAGRPSEARRHAVRGLEIAEQMGDWYIASVAAWLGADVEDALGDLETAARLRRKELDWLARIGGNPHHEALAHAYLAYVARRTGDSETEAAESDRARKAAVADPDSGYSGRIETALTIERWSDLQEF